MSTLSSTQREELARAQRWALVVGGIAFLACVIGAWPFSPTQFFRAYLTAYQFYLGLGLGCLVILMVYHLTGGAWGFLIRRILEAGARTLPLLALLFLPIAGGVAYLYPWAHPELVAASKNLQHKHIYLNVPFAWARAALFFLLWVGLAYVMSAWSRRQEQTGDPTLRRRFARLSGLGLLGYGVSITFFSVDWVMSLQPAFRSTIFGPLVASGHLVSAHAFAIIVMTWLVARPPVSDFISEDALNDLGNFLFTFLIIWSYMAFFQFMLIWIANLPSEVIWVLPRSRGAWLWVAWALIVFHFAIPFFLLLMRDVKRDPRALVKVAGLLLFMHLVFNYYQVMPAFPGTHLGEHWMDFLAPIALGGPWLAYFLRELTRTSLLPGNDPNQETALRLHRLDLEAMAREEEASHD